MKRLLLLATLLCATLSAGAQTAADSLAIVSAKWTTHSPQKGVTLKSALIGDLYNGAQSINLVEISRSSKLHLAVAHDNNMRRTSAMASDKGAVAAINGTFYNMREGNSTCFYKIDREVIDSTTTSEAASRVNGAVHISGRKLSILDWTPDIERSYKGNKGTVLASGPVMLDEGGYADWSKCSESFIKTKHPRSAIYTTRDGKVVFITVDGRSAGNAAGVSIEELAHLIRVLGGYDALNLDGGGSTTLWIKDAPENGVVNYPCDNRKFDHAGERSVSNCIYAY
ncbi:MAG: phosphodiester glycosidase family protein [Alistipes sp.]|nr:phosphodiester glycosidase family protein [Alistipes sp.]